MKLQKSWNTLEKSDKIILLIGSLLLFFGYTHNIDFHTIKSNLAVSEQILNGKTLYKDIPSYIAPGVYYFNALLLIFSSSLYFVSIMYCIVALSISTIIFFLSKEIFTNNKKAYFPFFVSILCQATVPNISLSLPLGILILLLASLSMFKYYHNLQNKNITIKNMLPIGVCIALLCFIRQDMASYMYGLFFWAMFWAGMADVEGLGLGLIHRAARGFWQGVIFTIFVVATTIPLAIFLIYHCGLDNLITQLIEMPMKLFSGNNSHFADIIYFIHNSADSPNYFYYSLFGITFYLPVILAITAILLLIYRVKKKTLQTNTSLFWNEMLIINLTLNLFNYALLQPDIRHLFPSLIFSSMLVPNIIREIKCKYIKRERQ